MPADQGPNMEVRAFIAVVLSLGVMVGYQYFFAPAPPDPGVQTVIEAPLPQPNEPAEIEAPEQASAEGAAPGTVDPDEPAIVAGDGPEQVTLETERYRMVLDNRGGLITSVELLGFDADFGGPLELVVHAPGVDPVGLLSLVTPEQPEVAAEANNALYRMTINGFASRATFRAERPVEIRWQWVDAEGWSVDKRLTVSPDGYLSDLRISVESPVDTPMFLTLGPGLEMGADTSRVGIYLMSGAVLFDGAAVDHVADGDLETPEFRVVDVAWGGIQSSYFAALFVPEGPVSVYLSALPPPELTEEAAEEASLDGDPGTLAVFGIELRSGLPVEMPLFIGPKDYELLAAEGHDLERVVDYGTFRMLARPVAVTLETLYEYTGNYGLAIILATFGVRLIFFPLSQRSMKSMRKMQKLQPQMNAIRAKYKGVKDTQKRQEMNTEVMQLYKDNGVSPLGGCLPMLLQMPVLFGFYAAISVSIISRHAPFGLWIQDLSIADPYYVTPILMGVSMVVQQKMTPAAGDPTQRKMMMALPIVFTFFFLNFSSGLVLYFLFSNLFGMMFQFLTQRWQQAVAEVPPKKPTKKK